MTADGSLDVIALVSGGKDSFFSILHCLANGHRIVALANLYPPTLPLLPLPLPTATATATATAETKDREVAASNAAGGAPGAPAQKHGSSLGRGPDGGDTSPDHEEETDLNSFMYQTVGHQVIPLYAQATGLPLFRQPIVGTAVYHGVSYQDPHDRQPSSRQSIAVPGSAEATDSASGPHPGSSSSSSVLVSYGDLGAGEKQPRHVDKGEGEDETESLVPLLCAVMRAHPEANALCTGAILSTYQRTRIESVALRLGLVPLAYIWQFPELPRSSLLSSGPLAASHSTTPTAITTTQELAAQGSTDDGKDDSQLLRDMAVAGLDARIIKVASGGLDESFLWENVASTASVARVERAMRRFGGGGKGSVLGEGGEFETLVVDGPAALFRGRIVVHEEARRVVREGGGCAWLSIRKASVEMKEVLPSEKPQVVATGSDDLGVRIPRLLDPRFEAVITSLRAGDQVESPGLSQDTPPSLSGFKVPGQVQYDHASYQEWCFVGGTRGRDDPSPTATTVEDQTSQIVDKIRARLQEQSLSATAITNSIIVLRRMSDFSLINKLYGSLFLEPNPPSRVTISCGDVLAPPEATVAIYLSVQPHLKGTDADSQRRGLHVQSRSYWAPANIGPYSQAIAFPLLRHHRSSSSSPLAVCIAGQIPLLPASMILPPPGAGEAEWDNLRLQTVLALQHLWRVGAEMKVRWWTSAVAYFPRTASAAERGEEEQDPRRRKALLAAAAWRAAHLWPRTPGSADEDEDEDEEEEEETGPDLWDRRYNPLYRSYAGDSYSTETPSSSLPDWDVLATSLPSTNADDSTGGNIEAAGKRNSKWGKRAARLPPVFAAEVDELPRAAGVEWHAHVGLAGIESGAVRSGSGTAACEPSDAGGKLDLHHVVVVCGDSGEGEGDGDDDSGLFIQSTAVLGKQHYTTGEESDISGRDVMGVITTRVAASLRGLLASTVAEMDVVALRPKITYVDGSLVDTASAPPGGLIPCRSLWDSRGNQLAMVAIYETRLVR